ncbi:MAG: DUF2935 domain-containing protein [Bacillota bacterium]|nr:DUF2935 domain-containing protein [Bacillota bacterium]
MISNEQYVRLSLEANLFFLRIVKEHAIFAAASLPAKYAPTSAQFVSMKNSLERLLSRTLALSHGNISSEVMNSSELVTNLTLPAEKEVQALTGIPVNTAITVQETNLGYRDFYRQGGNIVQQVSALNREIIRQVTSAINFQSNLLRQILTCKAFSFVYPTNLDHVTREARAYVGLLNSLENKQAEDISVKGIIEQEIFWNEIMDEHAKFIRGYLDPSETKLFKTADNFADRLDALEAATVALRNNPTNLTTVTNESRELVTDLRNFKRQGTEGLVACKIKAIMPALLADHVTREANHYLRLLSTFKA